MKKAKQPAPTIEEALGRLTEQEKKTELAVGVTVVDVCQLIHTNDRNKITKFIYDRFYCRYIMPFEKVPRDYNSGFAQMAACCLMIEAMESFHNGWNDTTKDAKSPNGDKINGGKIFEGFFKRYAEFTDFVGWGDEFYKSIRCGLLHQAETKNGWTIVRKGEFFDQTNRTINTTIFRRRMKKCLAEYCDALQRDDIVWGQFKDKMAFIISNCHKAKRDHES
jgi:hypothetical protein